MKKDPFGFYKMIIILSIIFINIDYSFAEEKLEVIQTKDEINEISTNNEDSSLSNVGILNGSDSPKDLENNIVTTTEDLLSENEAENIDIKDTKDVLTDPEPVEGNSFVNKEQSKSQLNLNPEIDQSTGALQYNYSFEIPKGRLGLTPNLNLSYNSNSNRDISSFGNGWSISIPYIKRINKYGVDKMYESSYEVFVSSLDGELILVDPINNLYRPKKDNGSFNLYYFNNNIWYFTNKEGITYNFGQSTISRQDDPSNTNRIFSWMLDEVKDKNNNKVIYSYFKNEGQIYPDSINYSLNGIDSGIYNIVFVRQDKIDSLLSYTTGFKVLTTKKISEIKVDINGVWSKKYVLEYTNADNGQDSLLKSIQEVGKDEVNSTELTKPKTEFEYTISTPGWTYNQILSEQYQQTYVTTDLDDVGMRFQDINGDGLVDFVCHNFNSQSGVCNRPNPLVRLNNGNGWVESSFSLPNSNIPLFGSGTNTTETIKEAFSKDQGQGVAIFIDINGDGLVDIFRRPGVYELPRVYLNNGQNGWTYNQTLSEQYQQTHVTTDLDDVGMRFQDINGDGLVDFVCHNFNSQSGVCNRPNPLVRLNNGNGWVESSFSLPNSNIPLFGSGTNTTETIKEAFSKDQGQGVAIFIDINGDGLVDIFRRPGVYELPRVYLNNGQNGWTYNQTLSEQYQQTHVTTDLDDVGMRFQDINGDGLVDFVCHNFNSQSGVCNRPNPLVRLNNGNGWVESSFSLPNSNIPLFGSGTNTTETIKEAFSKDQGQGVAIFIDINGDGLVDIFRRPGVYELPRVYLNNTVVKPNLLKKITNSYGGVSEVEYKPSTYYKNSDGNLLNKNLGDIFYLVNKIVKTDAISNFSTRTEYTYSGGEQFFNGPFEKEFAGFEKVEEKLFNNQDNSLIKKSINYFHQGDLDSLYLVKNQPLNNIGESLDTKYKIGKVFRSEIYDSQNNLYSVSINNWNDSTIYGNSHFIYPTSKVTRLFGGESVSKDTAISYLYNTTNGNLLEENNLGEVSAQNDGSFSDILNDSFKKSYEYATDSTNQMQLVSKETILNNQGVREKETKYLYDNLPFGQVSQGLNTSVMEWIYGNIYSTIGNSFNSYGLKTSTTDPNGNVTSFLYDQYNLYPVSITKPLGINTTYTYDYSSGKPISVTNSNLQTYTYTYDPFDRIKTESIPDPQSGQSVLKTTYTYNDTPNNISIKTSKYLDGVNIVDGYTYFDSFNRPIQTSDEARRGYNVTHTVYGSDDNIKQKVLSYNIEPYTRVSLPIQSYLYTTYTYDPLDRVKTESNSLGTITHNYSGFSESVIDQNGKQKTYTKDAFGNLVQVVERLDGNDYSSFYEYNRLGKLIKITDPLGNIRNFIYDGLGLIKNSEDLHSTSDQTFGVYNYDYDSNGNLIQKNTPNGKIVNYSYNELNQKLSEDDTSTPDVDILYSYNSCQNGKEKLCSTTRGSVSSQYRYDYNGGVLSEVKNIDDQSFETKFLYDRYGNNKEITYPDLASILYTYDNGGNVNTISYRTRNSKGYRYLINDIMYNPLNIPYYIKRQNNLNTKFSYDQGKFYRLTNINTKKTDLLLSQNAQDISYTYDNVGNILSVNDTTSSNTRKIANYLYDDLYRLKRADISNLINNSSYSELYDYNILGNILSINDNTYSYNSGSYSNPHAPTNINGNSIVYDNDGNLISYLDKSILWTYRGEIDSIIKSGITYSYTYDSDGGRVKEINDGNKKFTPNKYFSKEGFKSNNNIYLGDRLIGILEGETLKYPLVDHLGSVEKIFDLNGTTLLESTDYYPFGKERIHTGTNSSRRYIGERYDKDTGLNYLNARYYDSERGQFLSQDPVFWKLPKELLSDPQQLNSYSYARNNPIRMKDPSGMFAIKTGKVEKGDNLTLITTLLNKSNSTNYTVEQVAKLNNISDSDKISVGQVIKPNNDIPDITNSLNILMKNNSENLKIKNPIYFAWKVRPYGDWDLKNSDQNYYSKTHKEGFVFNAENIRYDAPGNIHYGYVGAAGGYSSKSLKNLGSVATPINFIKNIINGHSIKGDDPIDVANIDYGINIYNSNIK
jgi:RHS repeat-associated protein